MIDERLSASTSEQDELLHTRSFRQQLSHKRGRPLRPAVVIIRASYYTREEYTYFARVPFFLIDPFVRKPFTCSHIERDFIISRLLITFNAQIYNFFFAKHYTYTDKIITNRKKYEIIILCLYCCNRIQLSRKNRLIL